MEQNFDIVIIGNSAAGMQALRTIRRHSRSVSVAMVDRENCPAYSRVLTPYYVGGKTLRGNLLIVGSDFYEHHGIATLLGHAAVELDAERHRLILADGTAVGFGQLLIAAGAEARGLEVTAEGVCTLRHLADADRLERLLKGARSVTAVGAGLVSIPLLSHAGPEVERHLVIGSDRVFSRVVDPEASAILEERFLAGGLVLHKRDDIVNLSGTDRLELSLATGKRIVTDMLLVGKGVVPNTDLALRAGLEVREGIVTDERCRTSHPHIFAAGDVAEGKDFVTGEPTIQGNWLTAVEQGEIAALNMLGFDCTYEGSLKNNTTEVFGVDVAVVGYCRDDVPRTATARDPFTGRFRKVFLDGRDRIIGATMIGETNDAGLYYQLVRTRAPFPGPTFLRGTGTQAAALARLA